MPAPSRLPAAIRWRARMLAFRAAKGGVAAIEFAIVLPVMCLLLFGLNEVTLGVNIDRKLTLLSRSLADLTSRTPAMSTDEMGNIFKAVDTVMQPFTDAPVEMIVSSVLVTKNGETYTGKIDWTCYKKSGTKPANITQAAWDTALLTKRKAGDPYPVPNGFGDSTSFIVSEALRQYTPTTMFLNIGVKELRETTPWPVRNVSKVTAPPACPT